MARPRCFDTAEYLQLRCHPVASGCVEWTGYVADDGYGQATVGIRSNGQAVVRVAHRVVWEMWFGPVMNGLQLDHLCRNRRCVNPEHLEPVTAQVNVRRSTAWKVVECINGHRWDEFGQWSSPTAKKRRRWCKQCCAEKMRRRRAA